MIDEFQKLTKQKEKQSTCWFIFRLLLPDPPIERNYSFFFLHSATTVKLYEKATYTHTYTHARTHTHG